jgi:amino acid adenylation domain-containing protein
MSRKETTVTTSSNVPVTLTLAQQRVWYLHHLVPDPSALNVAWAFRVRGPITSELLDAALRQIARRHQALRVRFDPESPAAALDQDACLSLARLSLEDREEPARLDLARTVILDEISKPFSLDRAPLVRTGLIELAPEDHVLWIVAHRLVFDRRSVRVFLEELEGCANSSPAPEDAVPQLQDLARQQRKLYEEGALEPALRWWREFLPKPLPVMDLPGDRNRPAQRTYKGSSTRSTLPLELAEVLSALAGSRDCDLRTLLMTSFGILLHRLSGHDSIVVGGVVLNQAGREARSLVGCSENTLPVPIDFHREDSFLDCLDAVRSGWLEVVRHEDLPFELLIEKVEHGYDASRSPVCQALFSYHDESDPLPSRFCGASLELLPLPSRGVMGDLALDVDRVAGGLELTLDFSTDLFDPPTAERLLDRYETLLRQITAQPSSRLLDLPILSGREIDHIRNCNSPEIAFPYSPAHRQIEEQAAAHPHRIAVEFEDQQLTYGELNAQANQLARHLSANGVGSGDLVGVFMERSPLLIAALLAVHKAGAGYVPLDPAYPRERLAYVAEDAGLAALLASHSILAASPCPDVRTICVDEEDASWRREPASNPAIHVRGEDLAYVIYTSGSTGKPKGVEILHKGVSNMLPAMLREIHMSSADTVLALTTISFDIAVTEIFLPLSVGAKISLVSREVAMDPQRLRRWIEEHAPTFVQATPATFRMLIDTGFRGDPNLRIIVGGEALSNDLAEQLLDRCHTLWDAYGPTETTVWATIWEVLRDQRVVIGKPLANNTAYVVDPQFRLVPIGVPGELCLGGIQLARGYRGRPDLTEDRFVANPFSGISGDRMYRTGDLVRLLEDGNIDYLGRLDHQVKIRGFRIELGEVEAALLEQPGIAKAVVVARGDAFKRQLVAYIVPDSPGGVRHDGLRTALRRILPDYMVPAHFVEMESLPLTPNGKVDRLALPAPEAAPQQRTRQLVPPRDGIEERLVEIWESELKLRPIGIRDDFFDNGGDSLLAARVMVRIERDLGHSLPLVTLFEAPTIEDLAVKIREQHTVEYECVVPIQARGERPPMFLVHGLGGNVLGYQALCRCIDPGQPVYGLQAVGLDGSRVPLRHVADMARHYIEEVQKVQPHGPYFLGGLSLGGVIALEMAHQLRAKGEAVKALLLLDAYAYGEEKLGSVGSRLRRRLQLLSERLRVHSRNLFRRDFRGKVRYVRGKIHTLKRRLRWMIRSSRYQSYLRGRGDLPKVYDDVAQAAWLAVKEYTPRPLDADALLLRAKDEPFLRFNDRTLGWSRIIMGKLQVVEVRGDHLTFLDGQTAREVADALTQYIEGHRTVTTQAPPSPFTLATAR